MRCAPPTTKLKELSLKDTEVSDAGCAALAAALDSGALPALAHLYLLGTRASAAGTATVRRRAGLVVL